MENGPGLKMYFLLNMGIVQPAMLVYQRVQWNFCIVKRCSITIEYVFSQHICHFWEISSFFYLQQLRLHRNGNGGCMELFHWYINASKIISNCAEEFQLDEGWCKYISGGLRVKFYQPKIIKWEFAMCREDSGFGWRVGNMFCNCFKAPQTIRQRSSILIGIGIQRNFEILNVETCAVSSWLAYVLLVLINDNTYWVAQLYIENPIPNHLQNKKTAHPKFPRDFLGFCRLLEVLWPCVPLCLPITSLALIPGCGHCGRSCRRGRFFMMPIQWWCHTWYFLNQ